MAAEHEQDAIRSATPESLRRAGAEDRDAADRAADGPPGVSGEADEAARIDGAAETEAGTTPEGATPKAPPTSGDPLADAHEPGRR
jgi:hypothetical protein